jgi:hypothetical protein
MNKPQGEKVVMAIEDFNVIKEFLYTISCPFKESQKAILAADRAMIANIDFKDELSKSNKKGE